MRLWGDADIPSNSSTGKLMAGWFSDIGLKIKFTTEQYGWVLDQLFNYVGDEFTPDWDLLLTYWGGDYDPGFLLSIFTGEQIENWNDSGWSDPEYDQLYKDQDATLDPQERLAMIHRMQEIFYEQSPNIVFAYPRDLEVYDTADWEGWIEMPAGSGSVINIWSYLNVHPKVAATETDSGSNAGLIVGIIVALVVVVGIVVYLVARRRGRSREMEV